MRRILVIGLFIFIIVAGIADSDPALARRGGSGRAEPVWSPDGEWLAIVSFIPQKWGVWIDYDPLDLATNSPRHMVAFDPLDLDSHMVYDAAFSPDSSLIATAGPEPGVRLWDVITFAQVNLYDARGSTVAISPDGSSLAATDASDTIRIFDVSTAELQHEMINMGVSELTFSPDGSVLASGGCLEDTTQTPCLSGGVWLWDVASGALLDVLWGDFGHVTDFAYSPDGSELAISSEDGAVVRWIFATREPIQLADQDLPRYYADGVAYSPDGSLFAYARNDVKIDVNNGQIVIWDRATDTERITLFQPDRIAGIAFNPDGSLLASGSISGGVRLWDVATGEVIAVLLAPGDTAIQ